MGGPSASVVVPTYRRPGKLRRVVSEVLAQLGPDDELVVVDDGSGDDSIGMLGRLTEDARVRVIVQANTGVSGARNRGVAESSGELLVFLDDDEIPDRGWLEAHRRLHPDGVRRAVAGSSILVVRAGSGVREIPVAGRGERDAGVLVNDSLSVRRIDFDAVGGFDTRFHHGGEDVDLGIRLRRAGVQLLVSADARVRHEIDRGYREFRVQRHRRGAASALLRHIHGVGILPDVAGLSGLEGRLIRAAARWPALAEIVGAALWLVVLAARRVGWWRVEASAAGRITVILGLVAERRALAGGPTRAGDGAAA